MEKDLEVLAKEVITTEYIKNNHSMEVTMAIGMAKAIEHYKDSIAKRLELDRLQGTLDGYN